MTPESLSGEEKPLFINYHPKEIVDFLEEKGCLTKRDLIEQLEFSDLEARLIILDLFQKSIITLGDWELDEERCVAQRAFNLTDLGRKNKENLEPVTLAFTELTAVSKVIGETANYVFEAASGLGLTLEELTEMAKRDNEQFRKIAEKGKMAVLKELSSDELRRLEKEIRRLRGEV